MKIKLNFAAALLLLICPALRGQVVDPFANVLISYDFNNLNEDWDSNTPAYCARCVWTTDLSLNTLNQGLHYGGPDGSKFRCFEGWDAVMITHCPARTCPRRCGRSLMMFMSGIT